MFKKYFYLLFLIIPVTGYAFSIPDKPSNYVNDYIQLLTPTQQAELNQLLKDFDAKTSTQVFVAIFNSLDDENLENVSMRLAEKWKVGQKGKDNGVILILFMQDRKLRIEVGYGLEGVLTDAQSKRIIQNIIVPKFKEKQYFQGILEALSTIINLTHDDYENEMVQKNAKELSNSVGLTFDQIFFPLLGFIIFLNILNFLRNKGYIKSNHSFYDNVFSSGGFSNSSSSWSSGGFSGGGGGSFGGGGSSGSW